MPNGLRPLTFVFGDFREHYIDFFIIVLIVEAFAEQRLGIFVFFIQICLFRPVETFKLFVVADEKDADARDASNQDEDGEGQQDAL